MSNVLVTCCNSAYYEPCLLLVANAQGTSDKSAVFADHKHHRHDQSIYSVLVSRYGIETEDIHVYGEWRGILRPDQAIYVHRRHFPVSKIQLRFKQ